MTPFRSNIVLVMTMLAMTELAMLQLKSSTITYVLVRILFGSAIVSCCIECLWNTLLHHRLSGEAQHSLCDRLAWMS